MAMFKFCCLVNTLLFPLNSSFDTNLPLRYYVCVILIFAAGSYYVNAECPATLKNINCVCFGNRVSCTSLNSASATKVTDITTSLISSPFTNSIYQLTIQNINNPRLKRDTFKSMSTLVDLNLQSIGLRELEVGAFAKLSRLKTLDLSKNFIKNLPGYVFRGLQLNYLHLQRNKDIIMTPLSFAGMTTTSLELKACNLKNISYDVLFPLHQNLTQLDISDNEISEFDKPSAEIFKNLEQIALEGNPFRCSCKLQWLIDFLQKMPNRNVMSTSASATCASPSQLKGRELESLTTGELLCDPPRLQDAKIELNLGDGTVSPEGNLQCTAAGYPEPVINWITNSDINGIDILNQESTLQDKSLPTNNYDSANSVDWQLLVTSSIKIKKYFPTETFTCTAQNAGGSAKLTFKIQWPPNLSQIDRKDLKNQSSLADIIKDRDRNVNQKIDNSDSNSSSIFSIKQFTLLELIGAILGTFITTLVIVLLLFRLRTTLGKRKEARKKYLKQQQTSNSQASSSVLPAYFPTAPAWSTTSNHTPQYDDPNGGGGYYAVRSYTPCSHEYDVPRLDPHALNNAASNSSIQQMLPADHNLSFSNTPFLPQAMDHRKRSGSIPPATFIDYKFPHQRTTSHSSNNFQ